MKQQRGLSLIGLLMVSAVIVAVALIGFKLLPAYIEYFTVKRVISDIASGSEVRGGTLRDAADRLHAARADRRHQLDPGERSGGHQAGRRLRYPRRTISAACRCSPTSASASTSKPASSLTAGLPRGHDARGIVRAPGLPLRRSAACAPGAHPPLPRHSAQRAPGVPRRRRAQLRGRLASVRALSAPARRPSVAAARQPGQPGQPVPPGEPARPRRASCCSGRAS